MRVVVDWNRVWLSVRAETLWNARVMPRLHRKLCIVGTGMMAVEQAHMSLTDAERHDGAVELCLDELNNFIDGLRRYSPTTLAVALRVHLETLLQALLEAKICTREEVRDFVRELERDALQYEDD